MTPAAPTLGNRGRLWGWEGRGHLPLPLQAALVCEVATCPASLLPVSPLFGLSARLAACGARRSPPPGSVLPRAALLSELGGNRPSTWLPGGVLEVRGLRRVLSSEPISPHPPLPMKEDTLEQGFQEVPSLRRQLVRGVPRLAFRGLG